MRKTMTRASFRFVAAALAAAVSGGLMAVHAAARAQVAGQDPQTAQAAQPPQEPQGALELLFDQGKRLADAFKYDEAVPLFDRLIATMTSGPEIDKPELLVQAYEQRARARFAQGNSAGAEEDFTALLAINPDFVLASDVSPRVVKVLDNVRRLTIGQLSVQVTPPGEFAIDGRTYTVGEMPLLVNVKSGEHVISATRKNYTKFEETILVNPSELMSLSITLERTSSSVAVLTLTDDVEVLLDGVSKGRTPAGSTDPLVIEEVPIGEHRLRFRKSCFVDFDLTLTVGAQDVQIEPVQLAPAAATVTIKSSDPKATVMVDGEARGTVGSDLTVCAGSHEIEVRGARGRFLDRREWKTGDTVTLDAELRSAVPLIAARAGAGTTPSELLATLEGVLTSARGMLFYAPDAAALATAMEVEKVPADWLVPGGEANLPKEVIRDIGRRLSERLGVQGVAAAAVSADSREVTVALLAAGSGEPDLLTMSLTDSMSQKQVIDRLSASLPALVRPHMDAGFIDVAGVTGAVVIRAAASSGLAAGDVVVSAGGKPVATVADLRAAVAAHNAATPTIALEVTSAGKPGRKVAAPVQVAIDTLSVRDPALLANRVLLDLQDDVALAAPGVGTTAASVGLAVIHMRLGNWSDALTTLQGISLPDGPGVSAGTVAYLTGLAQEGLGRAGDAQASFTKAAASAQARLWLNGPLVAPMARAKLQAGR